MDSTALQDYFKTVSPSVNSHNSYHATSSYGGSSHRRDRSREMKKGTADETRHRRSERDSNPDSYSHHGDRPTSKDRYREYDRDYKKDRDSRDRDYSSRSSRDYDSKSRYSSERDSYRGDDYHSRNRHQSRGSGRSHEALGDESVLPLDEWPRKLKNWDMPPAGFEGMTSEQVKATGLFIPACAQPRLTNLTPFGDPNQPSIQPGLSAPVISEHAKRIHVSGISSNVTEEQLEDFFNDLMIQYNFSSEGERPVVNVELHRDNGYALVEFMTADQATNAITFDGLLLDNREAMKITRPKDYQGLHADMSTFSVPGYSGSISNIVTDTPFKIFIGCIPFSLSEVDIIEIFQSFGPLRSFHLVREASGMSKGYGFCEYLDPLITDTACAGLNQFEILDKKLVVQRASLGSNKHSMMLPAGSGSNYVGSAGIQANTTYSTNVTASLIPTLAKGVALEASSVVQLINMVSPEELLNEEDYNEILEDIRDECKKYGDIVDIYIPRPSVDAQSPSAIGKVFIEYASKSQAAKALDALAGRKFGDNIVICAYYARDLFLKREFN